jgi:hypothetical protein
MGSWVHGFIASGVSAAAETTLRIRIRSRTRARVRSRFLPHRLSLSSRAGGGAGMRGTSRTPNGVTILGRTSRPFTCLRLAKAPNGVNRLRRLRMVKALSKALPQRNVRLQFLEGSSSRRRRGGGFFTTGVAVTRHASPHPAGARSSAQAPASLSRGEREKCQAEGRLVRRATPLSAMSTVAR